MPSLKEMMSKTKSRYPKKTNKVEKVMHEYKTGTLKSSSGKKVANRKQAIAIGLSEQRRYNS